MNSSKILIAEDDTDNRLLLVEYLSTEGHKVIGAKDGVEALSIINSQDVDVLIADIKMPRLDGMTLLSKVKRE